MKYCRKCGTKIPDGSGFCVKCGQAVQQMADQAVNLLKSVTEAPDKPGEYVVSSWTDGVSGFMSVDPKKLISGFSNALEQKAQENICGQCGYQNENGIKFCTRCGAKMMDKQETPVSRTTPPVSDKKQFCRKCGAPIEPGSKFCSACGQQTQTSQYIKCPQCGTTILGKETFCWKCGAKIE